MREYFYLKKCILSVTQTTVSSTLEIFQTAISAFRIKVTGDILVRWALKYKNEGNEKTLGSIIVKALILLPHPPGTEELNLQC